MADTIQYGMGQIRYSNTSTYMSACNFTASSINVLVSSDNQSDVYQDVILKKNNFNFDSDKAYLLKIKIPKDLNYNNTYRIKLIAASNSSAEVLDPDTATYQMVKYINVPKETNTLNSSRVIIYPVTSEEILITEDEEIIVVPVGSLWIPEYRENYDVDYITKVAIAVDKDGAQPGDVYYNNGKYYIKGETDEIEDEEILNKNDAILSHSWTSGHSISGVDFSFIFSPRDSDETYNQIWIEMFRETYDQDIYSDGIYGRKIDLDGDIFEAEVYELENLIDSIADVDTLTHIGVYSHPNTIMSINGEEIRVGQSGYYELNNFEIKSFGIAAETDDDKFIVDYQYQTITG